MIQRLLFCAFCCTFFLQGEEERSFQKICSSPLVYTFDHFLSDSQCDALIALARPHLKRNTVIDRSSSRLLVDSARTSLGMFFPLDSKEQVLQTIEAKMSEATLIPQEHGENLQVVYYGTGAEYRPHYDTFDPSTPGGKVHYARGGQRIATLIVYLNDPIEGGETVFPKASLQVLAQKGKALLFFNVDANGQVDLQSLHGGAPVIEGEKWILTKWFRELPFH